MWGGCPESVGRLSGECGKAVYQGWEECLEVVKRLSGGCGEAV